MPFCDKCGSKVSKEDVFCDKCGSKQVFTNVGNLKFFKKLKRKLKQKNNPMIIGFVLLLLVFGFYVYTTNIKLEKTQSELIGLKESANAAIEAQKELIEQQGEDIANQKDELEKSKKEGASLRAALSQVQTAQENAVSSTGLDRDLIETIASSVVRIACRTDSYSGGIQQGSGMLLKTSSGEYRVRTNLHVINTSDGSKSYCITAVYPDYRTPSNFLVYESTGYKFYNENLDIAYLTLEAIPPSEVSSAGTLAQLNNYARREGGNDICSNVDIGDHLSVFGYPGIGGDTLTITDGIVSGFEFEYGTRYIKTSAKIDHGNSGGVAVKDSGCVVGIPTFVQTGSVESIGRIMDLNYLFNVTL